MSDSLSNWMLSSWLWSNLFKRKASSNQQIKIPTRPAPPKPVFLKPPLGLRPKYIHADLLEYERLFEIVDAIKRYLDSGCDVPAKWFEELKDIAASREKFANQKSANSETM